MLLTQQKEEDLAIATTPTGPKLACGFEVTASGKWRAQSWYLGELEVTTTAFFSNSASLRDCLCQGAQTFSLSAYVTTMFGTPLPLIIVDSAPFPTGSFR